MPAFYQKHRKIVQMTALVIDFDALRYSKQGK
jgi:hypothetical protein